MSLWSLVHLRGRGLLLLVVGCVLLSTALLRWNTILINGVRDESYVFVNTSADRSNEIDESEMELPWWDGGPGCPSNYVSSLQNNENSTDSIAPVEVSCGQRAWAMGPRQRVVAFTLYGDDLTYAKGLEDNIVAIAQLYPGYLVRLYTDTRGKKALLCPLLQKYPTLYLCDVTRVPERFGDGLENIHPQMWRFAPMGDPQVQVLLIRDIDSLVNPREVAAVKEWLSSDTILHTMHDHPQHDKPIMAGMWGVKADQVETSKHLAAIRDDMFAKAHGDFSHGLDQKLLKKIVWVRLHGKAYGHASYNCQDYWHSQPWPTRRPDDLSFVGSPVFRTQWKSHLATDKECPKRCRPNKHKDWIYC